MEEMYECTKCYTEKPRSAFYERKTKHKKSVTSICRSCRSLLRLLKKYGTICGICDRPAKMPEGMGACYKCLKSAGLVFCKKCNKMAQIGDAIYAKKAICKDCSA